MKVNHYYNSVPLYCCTFNLFVLETSISTFAWIFCSSMFLFAFWSSHPEVSCKKDVLRYFAEFTGKHLCQSLFFIKKETLGQMFSCKFCEIFKNIFFHSTPPVAASVCYIFRYILLIQAFTDFMALYIYSFWETFTKQKKNGS